jgi:predicted phage terminase large subunit-like protein
MSKTALDEAYEWYTSGPRQRLQPGGAIVVVMTRWSVRDLTGRLVRDMGKSDKNDQWEVIELPAILPSGDPVWPEYWSLEELEGVQAALGKGPKWHAQYMQKPTSEEGALIKREWWKTWEKSSPPPCDYIIQSYDTAFLKTQTSDYSAITTWGVFYPEGRIGEEMYNGDVAHLILLDSVKERLEFPELKRKALELYEYWEPDTVIIESKGSGTPLTQELRRIGIPVQNFTPSKGADKVARVNSCTPLFESGMVWRPDQPWADEMVEECVAFPAGDHDDLVDSMSQAILRFRQGGFVQLASDYEDEYDGYRERKMVYY